MRRPFVVLGSLIVLTSFGGLAACGSDGESPSDASTKDVDGGSNTSLPQTSISTTNSSAGEVVAAAPSDAEALLEFVNSDDPDGPFYMVNLIGYRDDAVYADGRDTDLTGREADAIYGEWMREVQLPEMGAEIVYLADVEADLVGGSDFERVAVVRYPSRAEFFEMATSETFQEMLVHKDAGVADTVVLATQRREMPSVPLPSPEQVEFPATANDSPFAFMHVMDFKDLAEYAPGDADADPQRSGIDAVEIYSANAGAVATPLGVRPVAWFDVEAVIRGDNPGWEEVRINWFPSHAAFEALTTDPGWAAGSHHRAAGLEQTYAIQTLPVENSLSP